MQLADVDVQSSTCLSLYVCIGKQVILLMTLRDRGTFEPFPLQPVLYIQYWLHRALTSHDQIVKGHDQIVKGHDQIVKGHDQS